MSDTLRGQRTRRSRGGRNPASSSVTSSARSSGVYVEHDGNGGAGAGAGGLAFLGPADQQHLQILRPAPSRFSLNEQFASTRREYEFGYDDASSFIERSTTASAPFMQQLEGHDHDGLNDDYGNDRDANQKGQNEHPSRNYFELLCLPYVVSLPTGQVRAAYYRLFRLLDAETQPQPQPPALRDAAAAYLADLQLAFETLVEGPRREAYLLALLEEERKEDSDFDGDDVVDDEGRGDDSRALLARYLRKRLAPATMTDLGVRLEAQGSRRRFYPAMRSLDFCLGHSTIVPVPAVAPLSLFQARFLQRPLELAFGRGAAENAADPGRRSRGMHMSIPVLTISASAYGLSPDGITAAAGTTLLSDRYQPLLSETLSRRRMAPLLASRLSPLVTVRLRQEAFSKLSSSAVSSLPADAAIELEADLLPSPSFTVRTAQRIHVEGEKEPLVVETMAGATSGLPALPWHHGPPLLRAGVALHRRVAMGTAFLCADSGDSWSPLSLWPGNRATCAKYDFFCRAMGREFLAGAFPDFAFRTAPTLELGCTSLAADELGLLGTAGRPLTAPADRGLKGLDLESNAIVAPRRGKRGLGSGAGSWTISSAMSSGGLAAYARYGLELTSALPAAVSSLLPFSPGQYHVEMELCATTGSNRNLGRLRLLGSGGYVALRALRHLGPRANSKFGVEVGLSPWALHVSLYWSRLASSQRLRLPLLLRSPTSLTPTSRLVFWAVLLPLAGLAALDLFQKQSRTKTQRTPAGKADAANSSVVELVARRRAEADALTAVLATGTQARQAAERARGGLFIIGAKYGVPAAASAAAAPDVQTEHKSGSGRGWGGWCANFEVADVTIAVAALVSEHGDLVIPAGLRKSRILGFWDPAPRHTKVLQIRYLHHNKEGVIEVRGREELRLPILSAPEAGGV